MSLDNMVRSLGSLNEADLVRLNNALVHELKHKRRQLNRDARNLFRKGDQVSFGDVSANGKRSYKEGTVHAIKRTRAQVQVGDTVWTVPLNMLQAL
jgi:hypothetical protein